MRKYLLLLLLTLFGSHSTTHADSWLSWSEFDENGENIQVYLTRKTESEIGPVQKITQRGLNVTPSLMLTQKELWVAWVDRANKFDYRLRYARIDSSSQRILESGTLPTSDRKIYSPVLAVSPSGLPVIAWSGLNGKFEDVRLAYFQNGRWSTEQRITNNKRPDTQPFFGAGENGELVLGWEHIAKDGVSVLEYALPSSPAAGQPKTSQIGIHDNIKVRENNVFSTLPVSLHARQSRFLMGTRKEIPQ